MRKKRSKVKKAFRMQGKRIAYEAYCQERYEYHHKRIEAAFQAVHDAQKKAFYELLGEKPFGVIAIAPNRIIGEEEVRPLPNGMRVFYRRIH